MEKNTEFIFVNVKLRSLTSELCACSVVEIFMPDCGDFYNKHKNNNYNTKNILSSNKTFFVVDIYRLV